ncbi:MAG: GGDEF domain-containing protein, partial [Proteobacteria bacterium]|nr:GGDEF domain-containing protein [Pseudomonadota bacterium]
LHRLIEVLFGSQDHFSLLGSTLVSNAALGLGLGVVIIPSVGFLLMTRERDERMLREDEERFRQLADATFEGIVIHEKGKILDVNQSMLRMTGYGYDEMIGTDGMRYVDDASRELALRSMQSGYDRPYEIRVTRKDGGTLTMEAHGKPIVYRGTQARVVALHDITKRKEMEEAIRDMSLRDPLTGLYNRRGFMTLGEQQLKAAHRAKRPMLLVFLDVDELKWINDKLGHDEGDRALVDTANILRLTFRESDIIARIGGDEFAVLAIDAADMSPEFFSKRIGQDIHEFNTKESRPYRLAVSHGAALYDPESQTSLEELISAADELMYVQKRAKGSR